MSIDERIADAEAFMEQELVGDALVSITKYRSYFDVWIRYQEHFVDFKVYAKSFKTLKEELKENAKVLNRKSLD